MNYETIMQPIQTNQAAFEAAMQRPMQERFVVAAEPIFSNSSMRRS